MNMIRRPFFGRRGINSVQRKNMALATYEGVPASVQMQMLTGPFLTGYLLYLGASSKEIGIVLAIPALATVVQLLAAILMQRMTNRKRYFTLLAAGHRIIVLSTALIPLFLPSSLWVTSYILIYFTAFVCNSAAAVIWTSMQADIVPPRVRGKYFGIRYMLHGAVGSAFLYGGGLLLDHWPGLEGFMILYAISAFSAIINLILMYYYPNPPFEKSEEMNTWSMMRKPFYNRSFLRATLFLSLWMLVQGIALPFFSYVMLDVLLLDYKWVSAVTIVQTMAMVVSYYIWGVLQMRHSVRKLLRWTMPVIAASCLVWSGLLVLPVAITIVAAHILLGIGLGGFNQMVFNFSISDTPKGDRPMYLAVFGGLTGIAGFVGPLAGGVLYEISATGPDWVVSYGIFGAVGLLLLLLAWIAAPQALRSS